MQISRRVVVQGPLGFFSGLPLLLTGGTLTARLTQAGVNIETIGLFALIALPYNFKFLWAPLFDRWQLFPGLGRRRGWMALLFVLLAVALVLLGAGDPTAPQSIAMLALAVAFLSATQDVLVDAYRTDVLTEVDIGRGTATYVIGYRVAMITAGALALMLSDVWPWPWIYWTMAGLVLAGLPLVLLAPPLAAAAAPTTLAAAVVAPLREFFSRTHALWALGFVAFYKFGDALAIDLINPFLLQLDFSGTEVGAVQKGLGIAATIVGVGAGGFLLDRRDLRKSLVVFGLAQSAANLGYVVLALTGKNLGVLIAAAAIDNICNGLGTAAFVSCLAALCDKRYSAFQYALLTSASSLLARLVGAGSGWGIARFGWAWFFAVTCAVGLPALLFARRLPLVEAAAQPEALRS